MAIRANESDSQPMTSRQRAYQIRHRASGLCIKCRKRAKSGLCKFHRAKHNEARATEGHNAKRRDARRRKTERRIKTRDRTRAYRARQREKANVLELMKRPWVFFGLMPPYTESDVRRAFMNVVRDRGMHPDRGGDPGMFKFFNIMKQKAIESIVPMAQSELLALPERCKRRRARQ